MADDKPADAAPEHKAFVGGISYKVDERGLKEMFERYNPINAVIQVDKMTQRPRGFGFVIFKDRESLTDAVREMHNKEVDGRTISVKDAIPQDQIRPGQRLGGRDRDRGYGSRDRNDSRGGYGDRGYGDRYGGGGYDRGYDRGYGGGGGGGYDPRGGYPGGGYERGYDRGYGSGYGGAGADRADYYSRDAYARDPAPTYPPASYDRAAYDSRSGYGSGYDSRYPADYAAYDRDRYAAGGPDRSRYPAPRPGPYDRPIADTRRDARPSR